QQLCPRRSLFPSAPFWPLFQLFQLLAQTCCLSLGCFRLFLGGFPPNGDQLALGVIEAQPKLVVALIFPLPDTQPQFQSLYPHPAVLVGLDGPIALAFAQPPAFELLLLGAVAEILVRLENALVELLLSGPLL